VAQLEPAYIPTGAGSADATPQGGAPALVAEHATRPGSVRQSLFESRGWIGFRVAIDFLALVLGNVAALTGAAWADIGDDGTMLIWLYPALVCGLLAAWGLYKDTVQARIVDGIGQVLAATSLAAILLIAGAALLEPASQPAPLLARAWLFGALYLGAARMLLTWAHRRARATRLIAKPTLIVGAGQIGGRVERRLIAQPELGLLPVGYLDSDPPPGDMVPDRTAPVLGGLADLGAVAHDTEARHVVLGFSAAPDHELIPIVRECELRGLEVSLVPRLFESINERVALEHLGGLPLFGLHSINPKGWQFTVKHVLDAICAAALIVLLLPLLLAIALAVKLSSPGPVLFRQRRIGRDGRDFEMLKFRSMRLPEEVQEPQAEPEAFNNLVMLRRDLGPGGVEGADRRTAVGTFIRRSGLDELPQLINVLRGEMSFVGPRPERPEFVNLFGSGIERYSDRHRVKSGITGWAQVNGFRGKTSLRDRVEWDNYYIENWSLSFDLKILLMTVTAVFDRAE
jgi:exopolysaccharide biosynthesis polyprenyl glycosylphosphotransferase